MPSRGIAVRPVNDTAFLVPFVLAAEREAITFLQRHAWSEIDVVCDQHSRFVNAKEESLMPRSLRVIAKDGDDRSASFDFDVACM